MELKFDDMGTGYPELVECIRREGRRREPRGQKTFEIPNMTVVLSDPTRSHPDKCGRKYGKAIAAAEAACLVGGIADPELMIAAGPTFVRFLDGGALHGAYGPRIRGQLANVVARLEDDPDTRQAYMQVWDARYDQAGWVPKDLPCTLGFNFGIYDGRLEMSATMRSNDVWYGVAHDFPMFTCLQATVAGCLGLPLGPYTHHAYSLHLYERDIEAVDIQLDPENFDQDRTVPWGGFQHAYGDLSNKAIDNAAERAREIASGIIHDSSKLTDAEMWMTSMLAPIAPDRGQFAGAGLK